jgi:hypothetical protein
LIDGILASGTKQGYVYQLHHSPDAPDKKWMATAAPAVFGTTGERYFAANQDGVIYYRTDAPFELNAQCEIDVERALLVGQ